MGIPKSLCVYLSTCNHGDMVENPTNKVPQRLQVVGQSFYWLDRKLACDPPFSIFCFSVLLFTGVGEHLHAKWCRGLSVGLSSDLIGPHVGLFITGLDCLRTDTIAHNGLCDISHKSYQTLSLLLRASMLGPTMCQRGADVMFQESLLTRKAIGPV